jgi:hypothetical protein
MPAAGHEKDEMAAITAATEKYADVNVALSEGFIPAPPGDCISAKLEGLPPEWGAMGTHYINPGMLKIAATEPRVTGGSTHTDFLNPAILLYEPQSDGSLVLIGVENLVFQRAWKEAGNDAPPSFGGREWDAMADDPNMAGDQAHGFEPHYDLHVWAYRENPSGALMPFNPNVTCEHDKSGG